MAREGRPGSAGFATFALVFAITAGVVVGAGVTFLDPSASAASAAAGEPDGAHLSHATPSASARVVAKKAAGKKAGSAATVPVVGQMWPANTDGAGCPAPRYPRTLSSGSPAQGRRVLVIGDSRTRDSRDALINGLVDSGWTPTVRCWGWKHIDWGIEQVKQARELDQLPPWVVVALGVNDMGGDSPAQLEDSIDRMLREIGPGHRILWMEEYSTRSPKSFRNSHVDYPAKVAAFNRYLSARAGDDTGLTVIPWVSVVTANHLGLFDGIHYGTRGYRYRAEAVVGALNSRLRSE